MSLLDLSMDDNETPSTMNKKECYRCRKIFKNKTITLVPCNYEPCKKYIHESCVFDKEIYQEIDTAGNNVSVFYCEEHTPPAQADTQTPISDENNINHKRGAGGTVPQNTNETKGLPKTTPQTGTIPKHTNKITIDSDDSSDSSRQPQNPDDPTCRKCKQVIDQDVIFCKYCNVCYHFDCLDFVTSKHIYQDNSMICVKCRNKLFYEQVESQNNDQRRVTFNDDRKSKFLPSENNSSTPHPSKSVGNADNNNQNTNVNIPRKSSNFTRMSMNTNYPDASFLLMDKMSQKVLPDCINTKTSWISFYALFLETKDLYSTAENYKRVTDAIKSDEIKKLGGDNLYDITMFEEVLSDINEMLENSSSVLATQYHKLTGHKTETNTYKIADHLIELINFTKAAIRYKQTGYINTRPSINNLVQPLPKYIYQKCIKQVASLKQKEPSMADLLEILKGEYSNIQTTHDMQGRSEETVKEGYKPNNTKTQRVYQTEEDTPEPSLKFDAKFCWFHNNSYHPTNKCRNLWALNGKEVVEQAKQHQRCLTCGQAYHANCPFKAKLRCNIKDCGANHYALYCPKRVGKPQNTPRVHITTEDTEVDAVIDEHFQDNQEDEADFSSYQDDDNVNNHITKTQNKIVSSPTILGVITLDILGKRLSFLYDTGSTVSMIEEAVADDLRLKGINVPLTISGAVDQGITDYNSRMIQLEVKNNLNNKQNINLYFRTMKNLNIRPQRFVAKEFKSQYKFLHTLNLKDHYEIMGIIGTDNPIAFCNIETFVSENFNIKHPIGYKTPVGDFVIYSQVPLQQMYEGLKRNLASHEQVFHSRTLSIEDNKILKEMESSALNIIHDKITEYDRDDYDDHRSLESLKQNVVRVENSPHFKAPLLWREENITLPSAESKKIAMKRFLINEHSMLKNNIYEECEEQVNNLLKKGYAIELSKTEIENYTNKTFYIPVFFVQTKRLRMIWDGASKVNGKSLNDFLITGPNLYNEIINILYNMRSKNILIVADIQEMFHQTFLTEEDTECSRFLFRFKNENTIREFKMKVLPFGLKCSPTIAQYVKNLIADEVIDIKPRVANVIKNNTYVDDIVKSINSEEEAINLLYDMRELFEKGGFNMIKVNSNNKNVLREFLNKYNNPIDKLVASEEESKILGYTIDFAGDTISIAWNNNNIKDVINISKRDFLSLIMSLYDPLGLVEFIKSNLKSIYRDFASSKYEWDDILYEKLNEEERQRFAINWKKNLERLHQMSQIKIPRCLCKEEYQTVDLHVFGDAGATMLCGLVFARFLNFNGEIISIKLIQGKTYTVPIKGNRTIPEKELDIACKLIQLTNNVVNMSELKFDNIWFYTDSTCVYYKILNDGKSTIYENNRLRKIKEGSKLCNWRWIPSEKMPADYGTKINYKLSMSYNNEWYEPSILKTLDTEFQPESQSVNCCHYHRDGNNIKKISLNKFSKLSRAIQFFQSLIKFRDLVLYIKPLNVKLSSMEKGKTRAQKAVVKSLTTEISMLRNEINNIAYRYDDAEIDLLRYVQQQSFTEEYKTLKADKTLPKNHFLSKWLPWIDKEGLMRITTRLSGDKENIAIFGYNRIFPIILPKNHKVTELYIMMFHVSNKHSLIKNVIASLKARFFIQHTRSLVKSTIDKKCMFCIRYKVKPVFPLMGDLPEERLAINLPAFTHVMVDLCGPIKVNISRNVCAERYILVYSCLTTRALHLELIESLNTDATLIALQNCINLRGAPATITSDNGTNFVGANNTIQRTTNMWNERLLTNNIIIVPIKWKFGPAKASHMQGSVERMVGLVKSTLKTTLLMLRKQIHNINDFTLRGILFEIIGILNNRPLNIDESYDIITPNSFLMQKNNFQEVPHCDFSEKTNLKNNWENVKKFTSSLWKTWVESYLPSILSREKWIDKTEPLKVGDLVITVDNNVTDSWRFGKIIETTEGSNNQVRKVKIQLGKNDKWSPTKLTNAHASEKYNSEKLTIVTRPAIAVAKIKIAEFEKRLLEENDLEE